MAYRKRSQKRVKRSFKRKSAKRRGKRTSIKKLIRREIGLRTENKCSQYYNYNVRLYASGNASFPTDNIFPLGVDPTSLVIPPGTGQGNRLGNEISTKKLVFKGTLTPLPYDSTFNAAPQPVQVKMWIFYDKTDPVALPNPPAASDFFQNGNGSKGFQNDLVDMWSPVNTDRYRVFKSKVFKLGAAMNSGSGGNPALQNSANNDFKYNCNFSINLTKYYTKRVKFNDGSTVPTTRGLFCMFAYANATGLPVTVSQYTVGLQYMLDYTFEDA